MPQKYKIEEGKIHPLGATPDKNGVNFSLFSEHATGVELLLFRKYNDLDPYQKIILNPKFHRTFNFWHIYVKGLKPGTYYAYRVDGPKNIHNKGHRFNKNKVLIDPYARGISNTLWKRADACTPEDNLHTSMRGAIVDTSNYDWENDAPLNRPMNETIIYELHARGFTNSPSSRCKYPGTFKGLIEKISYLKELGITAVELLPVFEFDNTEISHLSHNGSPLKDYWGYNTIGYFAPESAYCVNAKKAEHIKEFRDMVKALHKAGIEVILDVIFNHTGEGDHLGPTLNFKGIDNSIYYYLLPHDKSYYLNFSGCGNSFNSNHPVVGNFILKCLEYWVKEMHVDGFRFDQGSILSRGQDGKPMQYPPTLWDIELSEVLANTKIITEAWDASGLYQVGSFPGYRWAEWNGRYRDDIRRFVKGDPGLIGAVATRIAGSADIYESTGHLPINSINFITSHDGFTLNDLVSYNNKHNAANGDNNSDGANDNFSWNCGAEGQTNDPDIEKLRDRQIKNFIAILMLSQGVPMILAGDEIRRTQMGNNNAYCHDTELSWLNWSYLKKNKSLFRFFKLMIAFRKSNPLLKRKTFFTGKKNKKGFQDIIWHGCKLYAPGWNNPQSKVLSFTLSSEKEHNIHVILNMDCKELNFQIPPISGKKWYRIIDTTENSPNDIIEGGKEKEIFNETYHAKDHSVIVLVAK